VLDRLNATAHSSEAGLRRDNSAVPRRTWESGSFNLCSPISCLRQVPTSASNPRDRWNRPTHRSGFPDRQRHRRPLHDRDCRRRPLWDVRVQARKERLQTPLTLTVDRAVTALEPRSCHRCGVSSCPARCCALGPAPAATYYDDDGGFGFSSATQLSGRRARFRFPARFRSPASSAERFRQISGVRGCNGTKLAVHRRELQ